jgi:hypothetical protein
VSMDVHFREFKSYYTQEVSPSFGDSVDTAGYKTRGENGEMLVNVGSIPLTIPSLIEQKKMMKERKSLYVLGLGLRRR